MVDNSGDIVVSVSSSLISDIMHDYFNRCMFKQKVEIVDSRPVESGGYAFSLNMLPTVDDSIDVSDLDMKPSHLEMPHQSIEGKKERTRDIRTGRYIKGD